MPLIICEVSLSLTWSVDSVLTNQAKRERTDGDKQYLELIIQQMGLLKRKTQNCVYSSYFMNWNDIKLLDKLKSAFKIAIKWNKYSSKMTKQTKNINLNYLIDPRFTKVMNYLSYQL